MASLPALPARLTHVESPACLAACQAVLARCAAGEPAELDAAALQEFDSSAVALLLALARGARARGVELHLSGLSTRLRALAVLYGVGDLLPG
jgi:phospholipid transport system transporter-binding protein